jgi:hypothetical protein
MGMSKKTRSLSDGIRAAIDAANKAGVSRYAICRAAGMDQATMSRFMGGVVGLQLDTLDKLGEVLGLSVVTADRAAVRRLAADAPAPGRPAAERLAADAPKPGRPAAKRTRRRNGSK